MPEIDHAIELDRANRRIRRLLRQQDRAKALGDSGTTLYIGQQIRDAVIDAGHHQRALSSAEK